MSEGSSSEEQIKIEEIVKDTIEDSVVSIEKEMASADFKAFLDGEAPV